MQFYGGEMQTRLMSLNKRVRDSMTNEKRVFTVDTPVFIHGQVISCFAKDSVAAVHLDICLGCKCRGWIPMLIEASTRFIIIVWTNRVLNSRFWIVLVCCEPRFVPLYHCKLYTDCGFEGDTPMSRIIASIILSCVSEAWKVVLPRRLTPGLGPIQDSLICLDLNHGTRIIHPLS